MKQIPITVLTLLVSITTARAALVDVTITGTVEWNIAPSGPLAGIAVGQPATMTFRLDSDVFVNSGSFPTRGYVIDQSSFNVAIGSLNIGLQNPFPAGQTPFFTLRNNDPAVDGFFLATSTDFPVGVPSNFTGVFGQFRHNFSVTYGGTMLPSLDLLDALGTYDFTGLSVYNWTIDDGSFNVVGIEFSQLTIALANEPPSCPADLNGDGAVGPADLGVLLGSWGAPGCGGSKPCAADLNGDGAVGAADLGALLGAWGPCGT